MDHKSTMRPAAVGQSGQPRLIRPVFERQFNLSRARILWGSLIRIVALSPIVLAGACASIVSDNDSTTYIATEPQNARCELQGNKFKRVVDTPANISLPADAAPISVICEAEGFRQTSKDMDTSADGWIVGNILFGGIVGIAIDAARGAGQKYPEEFTVVLEPGSFESLGARDAWYDARRQEINEEWDEVTRTIDNECNRNMKELCTKKKADAEKVRAQELEALEQRRKTAVVSIPDGNSNPQALNGSRSTTKEMTRMEVPLGEPGAEQVAKAIADSETGVLVAGKKAPDAPGLSFDDIEPHSSGAVAKATPETTQGPGEKWIFEIMEGQSRSSADRQIVSIVDNKFSVNVSTNGWRGNISGEIDYLGNLAGTGTIKRMGYTPRAFEFSASQSNGAFHTSVVIDAQSGSVTTITINLTRG